MKQNEARGHNILLGTISRKIEEDKIVNSAILLKRNGTLEFFDKHHPMEGERNRRGVSPGSGSLQTIVDNITIGIVICADLWDSLLIRKLVFEDKIDFTRNSSFHSCSLWYESICSISMDFTLYFQK